ncbi:MAG: tRNA epoxyqueuosine(34) reductase QueG [Planctomycetota bacterium]|nr:tRNA epoxyqueuosine(34) reductase QueG [Planctomycetota bacterium]
METESRVLEMAYEAGFDLVGLTPLAPPPEASQFEAWLGKGRHGSMEYLERNRDRITQPSLLDANGKTLLMVGLGHSRERQDLGGGGRIARYALGRDYHNLMGKRLQKLGKLMIREGLVQSARARVDAVPLMERSHAEHAGLGYSSKACNLLHPTFGPWFFLGELILDVDLSPTTEGPNLSCGTCTACIDACPTGALLGPGELDARLCISYQTIENRGSVPHELRSKTGDWLFGCDICSEVCPWARKAPDLASRFGNHDGLQQHDLVSLIDPGLNEARFSADFQGSPLRRPKSEGLARNAAIVLGNRPTDGAQEALIASLQSHPSAFVREAAAWSLIQGYGEDQGVRDAVDRAAAKESGPSQALMRRSLDEG